MSNRLSLGLTVLLVAITVGNASVATAWPTSRLTALAARQDLADEVRVALAWNHGKLNPMKRAEILGDAQKILDAKELEAFRQTLDRISPPPPNPDVKRPNPMAQRKSASFTRLQAMQLSSRLAASPVMPSGVAQPERMASRSVLR
jgi:hypothetical protein